MDLTLEDQLAVKIYEAATRPELWPDALSAIASSLAAEAAELVMIKPDRTELSFRSAPTSEAPGLKSLESVVEGGRLAVGLVLTYDPAKLDYDPVVPSWLTHHLRVATRLSQQLISARTKWSMLSDLMDSQDLGVVTVDGYDTIVAANDVARSLLKSPLEEGSRLGQAMRRLANGDHIPEDPADHSLHVFDAKQSGHRILVLLPNELKSRAVNDALIRLYGLTPAEARLAELCGAGVDLDEAATSLGITKGTAKFVLQRIFHKTAVNRQSELVLLLSELRRALV